MTMTLRPKYLGTAQPYYHLIVGFWDQQGIILVVEGGDALAGVVVDLNQQSWYCIVLLEIPNDDG